jgi:hypothetical protein
MSDVEYLARFERLEIPGPEFRHIDHVHLAWIYLRSENFASAAARFTANLLRYVDHIGARGKYHETITWFYLVVINERIRRAHPSTWEEFAQGNSDLLDGSLGILRDRYGPGRLASALAREVFLLPG